MQEMSRSDHKAAPTPVLRIFLPFALGYFLSYLFRVVNAVIAPDLTQDLSLDPAQLGLLTATYFIAFASFQLPLGILLDRFGPRRIEAILLVFACAGAAVFALSHSLWGLIAGRALIGFGVSACLMAAFKSYVIWFPAQILSRVNGFQMAAGGLGALAATLPVQWALSVTSWRGVFGALSVFCLAAAAIVFWVVPDSKAKTQPQPLAIQIKETLAIFKHPLFWRIVPLTTLSQSGYVALQGLWAGPWLRDVAGLSRQGVAQTLSASAMAMILGFIGLGALSGRLAKHGISIQTSAVFFMAIFIVILSLITFDAPLPPLLLMVLFGFFGTSGILAYTALTLSFPRSLSGRVTTSLNLLVFISAFALQWAMGAIINLWEVSSANTYDPAGYRAAFITLLGFQILALAWFLTFRPKPGKHPHFPL